MKLDDTLGADPWHFARPDLAVAYLAAFDLRLSSARGLFARRRMGKTEFLRHDLFPAARDRGYLVAYTNLWDDQDTPDTALLAALRDALVPQGMKGMIAKLRSPISKVKAAAKVPGIAEGSLEADLTTGTSDKALALRDTLKVLDRQKKQLLLIIDEAQVLARESHANFAHALRAALDIRKDSVKVIFAGSSEHTLREMFAKSSEPFYNWAPLEPFPLLSEDFVAFTIDKLNSMAKHPLTFKQGMHAFEELHRTPEFFKRFVERYMLYQTLGAGSALEHTKASVFSDEHFAKQWDRMLPADRAVITMLAKGASDMHSAAGLKQLGDMIGKTATKNTSSQALRRLQAANAIARLSIGEYRIEDEAFAEWIRRRG
ncbi:hypothetical protein PO002_42900 [Cupriavidus necator]|uniref:hypothetical protein n=1 Tax=Cupriavidus necator TaxID=106590 RepID=UPI0039C1203F